MALAMAEYYVQQEERQIKPKEERQKRAMEVDSARPGYRAVSSCRSVRELTAMFEGSECY